MNDSAQFCILTFYFFLFSKVCFFDVDALMKKVENSRQMFIDEMKVKTDESKRIEKLDLDQLYGSIQGSFRKLQVD